MQCLDTSAAIEILRGSEKGREIKELLSGNIFITTFSAHELFVGASDGQLQIIEDFLKSFEVLAYSSECAAKSSGIEKSLSKQGKKINLVDVFIAGICMANNCTLITTDSDFKSVKGLDVKVIS